MINTDKNNNSKSNSNDTDLFVAGSYYVWH